jgi:hypothetical protein
MRIRISDPVNNNGADIDTRASNVVITNCYTGVTLEADEGDLLRVKMRNGGFEVSYAHKHWRLLDGRVDPLKGPTP